MKNYLRLFALMLLNYASTPCAWAQLKVGTEGLYVKSGTILSSDGLVLNPSANLTWSDLTLEKSAIAFTGIGGSGITRVYNFSTPTTFSGLLGFYYLTSELNGNTENTLQLTHKAAGSDLSYTVATGTAINTATRYLEKAYTATTFSTLSAGDPAFLAGSPDANLSAMTLSSGEIDPVFQPETISYKAYVNHVISSLNITPAASSLHATVKVNDITVVSGSASAGIPLAVGSNSINIVVTSGDGTVTKSYSLNVVRLEADQLLPDQAGEVTVNNTISQIVVISKTKPVVINVPPEVTTPLSIAYGDLITQGTGMIPQTTVTSAFARMDIPPATTITASPSGWDGVFITPTITTYTLPSIPGQIITPGLIIEVGSPDFSLSFDKAVRLRLTGQAGMRIARVHNGVYTEILSTGPEDSQAAGNSLPADGSFKINVGGDAIIWTKVFSTFISFNQKTDLNVALVDADKSGLTADLIKASNADLSLVETSLLLPLAGSFGSAITWTSSNPAVISADGKIISRPLFGSGNIEVTLTAAINKGLINENKSFTVLVHELANQPPTLTALIDQAVCADTGIQSIALSGISGGPEVSQTTTLSVSSDHPTMFSQLTINNSKLSYQLAPGTSGVINVTVTVKDNGGKADGGNDTFSRTFTLTVNSLPAGVISSSIGQQISKGSTTVLSVPVSTGTSYFWANASGISGVQNTNAITVRPGANTTYTVAITNATGCVTYKSFTVIVIEDLKALDVNNVLTPNGDGKNDFLVIRNLDMYPANTLKIFDRAGRQIFMKVNYQNDWDGSFKGSPLSEDSYYYIVDFGPGKAGLKGFVSIVR